MPTPSLKPPRTPKIYLLPNLLTGANLACGFTAIFFIFEGMRDPDAGAAPYLLAIGFILGACLFDALDGRVARLKGQESMFGREFDSLADIVSFGIAPALLVMDIVLGGFDDRFGWMIAFIYLVCGAMRLARFNCLSHEGQENTEDDAPGSKDFVGFPIPAAAGLIASLTVFIFWLNEGNKEIGAWRYVLLFLMLLLSFLMLSEFRYPSFKTFNWRTRRSMPWVFVMILVLVSAVAFWKIVPFSIFLLYLAYGCIRPFISRKLQREIEAENDDDDEEEDEAFEPALVEVKDESKASDESAA